MSRERKRRSSQFSPAATPEVKTTVEITLGERLLQPLIPDDQLRDQISTFALAVKLVSMLGMMTEAGFKLGAGEKGQLLCIAPGQVYPSESTPELYAVNESADYATDLFTSFPNNPGRRKNPFSVSFENSGFPPTMLRVSSNDRTAYLSIGDDTHNQHNRKEISLDYERGNVRIFATLLNLQKYRMKIRVTDEDVYREIGFTHQRGNLQGVSFEQRAIIKDPVTVAMSQLVLTVKKYHESIRESYPEGSGNLVRQNEESVREAIENVRNVAQLTLERSDGLKIYKLMHPDESIREFIRFILQKSPYKDDAHTYLEAIFEDIRQLPTKNGAYSADFTVKKSSAPNSPLLFLPPSIGCLSHSSQDVTEWMRVIDAHVRKYGKGLLENDYLFNQATVEHLRNLDALITNGINFD